MNFSKNLWDQFELIKNRNQEQRKYYEQFINVVNERVNLEEQYKNGLLKLNQTLQDHMQEEGNFANVISAMKSDQANRAQACEQLASSLRIEVVDKGREIIERQNNDGKKLITEGKKWEKDLQNMLQSLEKSKFKYLQGEKVYQQNQLICEISMGLSDVTHEKKQKNKQKCEGLQRESGEYEQGYQFWISDFNKFIATYKQEMEQILQKIEEQDKEREEQLLDLVTKYLIFETQQQKSFEYDINQIITLANGIDLEKGMQDFIEQNTTKIEFHKPATFTNYHTFLSQSIDNSKKNFKQQADFKEVCTYIKQFMGKKDDTLKQRKVSDTFLQKQFENCESILLIFEEIFGLHGDSLQISQLNMKNSPVILEEFKSILTKSEKNRRYFIKIVEGYRNKYKMKLNLVQFYRIQELFQQSLEISLNEKDSYLGRKILNLSCYFIGEIEGERISIQEKLLGLKIFRIKEFWEGFIYENLCEELRFQKLLNHDRKEMLTDLVTREKNVIFCSLVGSAQIMLNMDLKKKESKDLIQKYAKIYQLPDDLMREVVLSIDAFVEKEEVDEKRGSENFSQKSGGEDSQGGPDNNKGIKEQIENLLSFTQSNFRY